MGKLFQTVTAELEDAKRAVRRAEAEINRATKTTSKAVSQAAAYKQRAEAAEAALARLSGIQTPSQEVIATLGKPPQLVRLRECTAAVKRLCRKAERDQITMGDFFDELEAITDIARAILAEIRKEDS